MILADTIEDIIAALDCPVLGMFGETDHLISIADVQRFRDCLAPHGFLNDTMPDRYRPAQAEAAWAAQRAFLAEAFAPGRDRSRRFERYAAGIAADYDFSRNVRME